jgi:type 1 glutamine amidotransferase
MRAIVDSSAQKMCAESPMPKFSSFAWSDTMSIKRSVLSFACAALFVAAPALAGDDEPGFKSLFNGKDLSGWDGNPKFWSVRDGTITGQTTKENPTQGNTFLIWRDGAVDDFELRMSFRIVGGNSGIQYRSKEVGKWVVGGYQADFEAGKTYSGILYEERGRGILAQRGQKVVIDAAGKNNVVGSVGNSAEIQAAIKPEDWNDYSIIAQGNHLVHQINGRVTVDVTDEQEAKRASSGILALQLHQGPPMTVQFKNLRIKRTKLAAAKKIVLVAGTPSHGPGDHEFNAGVRLLKNCLDSVPGIIAAQYLNGWPKDSTAFDNADSVLLYMDGGGGHPILQGERLSQFAMLMKRGVGLACVHYAVEIPKERGGPELLAWIGGYYERPYSINPHWTADFTKLPEHPITRGVKPFTINDEWYFNMRFPADMEHVAALLVATPPDETRRSPAAAEHPGRPEVVAWAIERPGGGRGFGFTGGHRHVNWGNDDFRKLVLNALLWTAGAEVPRTGVASRVTPQELKQNLDPKGK